MKRLVIASLLCYMALTSFIAYCGNDVFGSPRPAVWRSSRTASADNFMLIASTGGGIHFHGIVITSPTLNVVDSRITIYNSTSAFPASVGAASACVIDLGERIYDLALGSAPVLQIAPRGLIPFDMWLSSGLVYDKTGASDINILWDYMIPGKVYNRAAVIWTP